MSYEECQEWAAVERLTHAEDPLQIWMFMPCMSGVAIVLGAGTLSWWFEVQSTWILASTSTTLLVCGRFTLPYDSSQMAQNSNLVRKWRPSRCHLMFVDIFGLLQSRLTVADQLLQELWTTDSQGFLLGHRRISSLVLAMGQTGSNWYQRTEGLYVDFGTTERPGKHWLST